MQLKELREKSKKDLERLLGEKREALRETRFRVYRGEEKGVRKIRELRKDIARILTLLR